MTREVKKTEAETRQQLALLLDLYSARELEDAIFEIFNEDSKRENILLENRERNAILHDSLRSLFRFLDQNPNFLKLHHEKIL